MSRSRARLTRKNSLFPPALRSVRNSRSAQGNAWQKCDFAALYYTLDAASRRRLSSSDTPSLRRAALLLTVQLHYIKRKSSLSRLSELLLFRRRRFTISTSSSTSTSSFTSSSEPNGNNISSVRLSRTARTSSEKFSHDFVRAERRQYSCGIVKRRLCKRSEKSRSEADL